MLPPLLMVSMFAGCAGESSRVEKVPDELRRPRMVAPKVSDRHLFGPVASLRPGQWASYREGERTFRLAAVGVSGDGVWIEVIEEGDPRQVSARLVSPDGVVRKAYYGEIGKDGSKSTLAPQTLEQDGGAPPAGAKEISRQKDEETVTVGGRELKTTRISVRFEDLEGRLTREVTWWHKDVPPIYAGSDEGGLVRRTTATSTLELTGIGDDARPLLDLPQ